MTVQDFINAVGKNPNFLQEELFVVTSTKKIVGGPQDGGAEVRSRPVSSVTIGNYGVLFFANPNKTDAIEIFVRNATPLVLAGPTPDDLAL